jgi:hypothetical protein
VDLFVRASRKTPPDSVLPTRPSRCLLLPAPSPPPLDSVLIFTLLLTNAAVGSVQECRAIFVLLLHKGNCPGGGVSKKLKR